MAQLFSLGIVPVQDWIQQARRSRDLRAGSVILWHLMARVLARLEEEADADVRVPRPPQGSESFAELAAGGLPRALSQEYGVPNRASGYLPAADADGAAELLGSLQAEVIEAWWGEWRGDMLSPRRFAKPEESDFWQHLAPHLGAYEKRVGAAGDCPFSLAWVSRTVERVPPESDVELLRRHLAEIDRLFSQVKRTRPVRPWPAGDRVGKCNQCAQREALGPAGDFDAWRAWHRELADHAWVRPGYRLSPGERLCWVCFAKRITGYLGGTGRQDFPSTGGVAAAPWLARVRRIGALREPLAALERSALGQEDLGRALHLPEEVPATSAESGDAARAAAIAAAKTLRTAIAEWNRDRAGRAGTDGKAGDEPPQPLPDRPDRYLALLAFDGDSMGERLRAAPDRIPAAMADFAGRVHDLLGPSHATAFYLGGDEGLVMAPAAPALALAMQIRDAFATSFTGICDPPPTLSLGLAFFEHTRPIAGAIRTAQESLAAAKRLDATKNALAVSVLTASGSAWRVVEPWGPGWERLDAAAALVRDGRLAAGWAYDVERFLAGLDPEAWAELAATDPETVRTEVKRLFFRRLLAARQRNGETGATNGERDADTERRRRQALWQAIQGPTWWDPEPGRPRQAPLPEQFRMIGFLARRGQAVSGDAVREGG